MLTEAIRQKLREQLAKKTIFPDRELDALYTKVMTLVYTIWFIIIVIAVIGIIYLVK